MERPKFTLGEYLRYKRLSDWKRDNPEWTRRRQYEAYWTQTIKDWKGQSEAKFGKTKEVWRLCWDLFEKHKRAVGAMGAPSDSAIASAQIDILQNAAYDKVAMLWSNFPIPVYSPVQESENPFIALANQFKDIELKENDFNTMGFDLGLDQFFCDMCLLKVSASDDEEGMFDQEQKIIIEQADPFNFWPDPRATKMKWDRSTFWIYEEEMELGEVHARYPGSSLRVSKGSSTTPDKEGGYGDNLKTLVPQKPSDGGMRGRDIVNVIECWFKDYREEFVANEVPVAYYEEGKKCYRNEIQVDAKGNVVGKWERAYPDGRCIVITDDGVVLSDFANPLWHNRAPFIPIPVRPGSRRNQLRPGEALPILRLHYKINDCEERYHRMAQNEIERPLLAETGAFPTPRSWYKTSKMAEAILVKNPGKEFGRMQPTETPAFAENYINRLNSYVDRTSGISAVMRGQLAEGSQISAEGMSSLQGYASSRLKMQAELIAAGMKELGFQLFWLIRQTYPSGISCQVQMSDGTTINMIWNERNFKSAWMVEIDSNSGLPGGQAAAANDAIMMFDKKLVDRLYALQAKRVAGAKAIDDRMKQDKLEQIKAEAYGRAMGVGIKQFEKADEKAGRTAAQR